VSVERTICLTEAVACIFLYTCLLTYTARACVRACVDIHVTLLLAGRWQSPTGAGPRRQTHQRSARTITTLSQSLNCCRCQRWTRC